MNSFIKQCKGIDADKAKIDDSELFYCSIKYDGVYVQIHKTGDTVDFFTSSGKKFYCSNGDDFKKLDFDFKIECEYICDAVNLAQLLKRIMRLKKLLKIQISNFRVLF